MNKHFYIIFILLISCSKPSDKAQQIVDKAIEKAGGEKFERATIDFNFRKHSYRSEREGGVFTYYRVKEDSTGITEDILSNDGFLRKVNGSEAYVHDTMKIKYSNSVNSVIYFALLPYGLNDHAVNKNYVHQVELDGSKYHKIRVTFDEQGGGEDFEDVFYYWINADSLTVDYLAYEYHTEGGGQRFRKAYNPRYIKGIRFVDYNNYKPEKKLADIELIDSLYKNDNLLKISEIKLENVRVTLK